MAQLAGIPESILARAQAKGNELETKIEVSYRPYTKPETNSRSIPDRERYRITSR